MVTVSLSDAPHRAGKRHVFAAKVRRGAVIDTVDLPESVATLAAAQAWVLDAHPDATFTYLPKGWAS